VFSALLVAIVLYSRQNKYIIPVVVIPTLSIIVVWIYDLRQTDISLGDHYVGTGIVADYYRTDRYIVQVDDASYIMRSEDTFKLGDEILFQAYHHPRYDAGLKRYDSTWRQTLSGGYVFDYAKRQYMRGFAGTLYSTQSLVVWKSNLSVRQNSKQWLRNRITTIDTSVNEAIMLGILLWDRSLLQSDDYQRMIDSGFVHLIAVSGGNIAFLVILLQLLLFFVPYYARLCIITACIVTYARLCGADSSVLRATIMGVLSIAALFAGRPTYIWRLLGIAWIALLAYNPYFLAYDIWLTLSFSAVIGIVLVQHYIQRFELTAKRHKILIWYITATIGASLGVMPFLLFFTYQINILSILTNIIMSPWVGILTLAPIGKALIPSWDVRSYPIQWMLHLAQWTAIHGIYIVVDRLRFAALLIVLAIGYFIYSMRHHSNPEVDSRLDPQWQI
jgi:ComEC/Rec2-related protein